MTGQDMSQAVEPARGRALDGAFGTIKEPRGLLDREVLPKAEDECGSLAGRHLAQCPEQNQPVVGFGTAGQRIRQDLSRFFPVPGAPAFVKAGTDNDLAGVRVQRATILNAATTCAAW